jgi:hypothetical protein
MSLQWLLGSGLVKLMRTTIEELLRIIGHAPCVVSKENRGFVFSDIKIGRGKAIFVTGCRRPWDSEMARFLDSSIVAMRLVKPYAMNKDPKTVTGVAGCKSHGWMQLYSVSQCLPAQLLHEMFCNTSYFHDLIY